MVCIDHVVVFIDHAVVCIIHDGDYRIDTVSYKNTARLV